MFLGFDICSKGSKTCVIKSLIYFSLTVSLDRTTEKAMHHMKDIILLVSSGTISPLILIQVRDELEQLLDDDDDMADLYLTRKLASASPLSGSGPASWLLMSPTIGSKISRASRASVATVRGDENDVEELEMLLEVQSLITLWS